MGLTWVAIALTGVALPTAAWAGPRRNLTLSWRWMSTADAEATTTDERSVTTRSADARTPRVFQLLLLNGSTGMLELARDEPVVTLDLIGWGPDGAVVGLRSATLSRGERLAARVDWPGPGRPATLTLAADLQRATGDPSAGPARSAQRQETTLQLPLDVWTTVARRRDASAAGADPPRAGRRVIGTAPSAAPDELQVRLSLP